ncbi:MAG TPA: hypothetical protein VMY78_06825 [Solirubrobacteraceae bacterium]|nr:hypothetical protein [Solirubrobacteraceae bacterium]
MRFPRALTPARMLGVAVAASLALAASATATTSSFTVSDDTPAIGQLVSFNASASLCTYAPCEYTWRDASRPSYPLGNQRFWAHTWAAPGTVTLELRVQDRKRNVRSSTRTLVIGG